MKIITENKKALHDYFIEDKFEAGIVLTGSEIKSIRQGKMNLKDGYVQIKNGEVFLIGAHISQYEKSSSFVVDQTRTRKLLLNASEIDKLDRKVKEKSYTIVPLKVYLSNNFAKIEIGLAKGKKLFEKKQAIKERDVKREISRQVRGISTKK